MFNIPGFNTQSLSDDEIVKKMSELYRRLAWASRFSLNFEIVGQLQAMVQALEWERRDRMMRQTQHMRDKMFPEIIETDPDMKAIEDGKEKEKTKSKPIIDGPEIHRSERPISQSPMDQGSAQGTSTKPIT